MPGKNHLPQRPDPEELLARVMQEEAKAKRGRHKIFIGFAAGVGKTYEMLNEANRRRQRGQDVVVGFIETHGREGTASQIGELEILPRKRIEYRGTVFEEMDTEAVLKRHPEFALVDELAHTNIPGSEREKRWQDVEVLLDAGINVLSTLNIQHLESLNDTIFDITGVRVRETLPDRILSEADEIKMVDITARALIHRLERGDIYAPDKVERALENWFREGNLNALREIALREIAQEIDEEVVAYHREQHITEPWASKDRILIALSPTKSSTRLLRRGWRMAQRLNGSVIAVYVENRPPKEAEQRILKEDFALAEQLQIPVVTLQGRVAEEIIRYCMENNITQVVLGHSDRSRWTEFLHGSIINDLTRSLRTIDILIVAHTASGSRDGS